MIKNRRELAIAVYGGGADYNNISVRLHRIVEMWLSRNEVKRVGNLIIINK